MNFVETLKKAEQIPVSQQRAQHWNAFAMKQATGVQNNGKTKPDVVVGGMYMFHYDPKHKETLPYYDTFPIIFPIEKTKDGFVGLNLHYLHPRLRARLFDELYKYKTNDKMDKSTKLAVSYQLLKGTMSSKLFVPCIKRYLSAHVRSSFLYIDPEQWNHAMLLPLQDFRKKTASYVWDDSARKIKR